MIMIHNKLITKLSKCSNCCVVRYSAGKSLGSVMFGARSLRPPLLRLSSLLRPAVLPRPRRAGSLKWMATSTGVTLRPDVFIFSITS